MLAALRGATDSQCVVSNDSRAAEWFPGRRVVADVVQGLGPLAGLETALRAANGAPVLVVAWDMPFVTAELLREIRAIGDRGVRAVVPFRGAPECAEPLCAYYAAEALSACTELLANGERRAHALFDMLAPTIALRDDALRRFGDPARLFTSIDSAEGLDAAGGRFPAIG